MYYGPSLREKTVVLFGPLTAMTQSLTIGLTQAGADVGLINASPEKSGRFASQMSDAREIHPTYGRSFAIGSNLKDEGDVQDALSRVAESFGGIDTYIDTRTFFNLSFDNQESGEDAQLTEKDVAHSRALVTEKVIPFLKGRKKGRVLFLTHQPIFKTNPNDDLVLAQAEMEKVLEKHAKDLYSHNVCINMLSIALTEDYLLYHYRGKSIQEALTELHKTHPDLQLTEFDRITNATAFFVSNLSLGITGQNIRIC